MKPYLIQNPPFPKNYADTFLELDYGKGSFVYDKSGNEYLDFGSGIAVNALGYGREDLAETAYDQMKKLIHVSNLYTTSPSVELAEKLTKAGGFAAVHFGNSGTEANEAALKYARIYAKTRKGDDAVEFISFSNGFHGRTMGALSVTATEKYKKPFAPLIDGCSVLPYNDLDSLQADATPETTAAIIVEPIQGEGGLTGLSEEMVNGLNSYCAKHDIILIADEVQTGMGRCGSLFASKEMGLNADIITLSKPLAGGLPLSATLIPAKVNDLLNPGDHGTTFGGGPVTCAVALDVFNTVSADSFLKDVLDKSAFLESLILDKFSALKMDGEIKGKGLLKGVRVTGLNSEEIGTLLNACREKGLLVLRSGTDVIRLAPPLIISKEELQQGVNILFNVIKEII